MEQSIVMPYWQVLAASVCGTSHVKNNLLCQDAHRFSILPDNVLVAVVADGAGSASQGKVGAMLATEAVVEHISLTEITFSTLRDDKLICSVLADAMLAALKALESEASAASLPVSDFATTLIIVVASPNVVAVAQIGDGAAVAKNSQGDLIALTLPDIGEYMNETTFLTSFGALDTAQVRVWREDIVNVAVFTDGLQLLAMNMAISEPHKPFFQPLFDFVTNAEDKMVASEQLVGFLRSDRITQRTDDDLTLVLAALRG
jgi:serine/threonine protein phosphatase PrpC